MGAHNLSAYKEVLRGREQMRRCTSRSNTQARSHFFAALSHDPRYAPAYAGIARTYNYEGQFAWGTEADLSLDFAVEWASRAVQLDRRSPRARAELGFSLLFKKDLRRAVRELRTAMELNPNDADIMAELADALTFAGCMEESVKLLEHAMRLNPYYPDTYLWYLADAHFSLRNYERAVDALERMTNPIIACRLLTASYAYLGRQERAAHHAAQVLRVQPDFSIGRWTAQQPDNPIEMQHLAEGLRKAGLPD